MNAVSTWLADQMRLKWGDEMRRNLYLGLSGTVFGLVACLHLARLVFGWQVQAGGWTVPFWLSWGGLVAAAILSVWAFRLMSKE